jgi:predicted nucleotidyltransferase
LVRPVEDYLEVYYDEKRWRILKEKREKAKKVMEVLNKLGLPVIVHGSVARGDVREDSDIDIVIIDPPRPFSIVEYYLNIAGLRPFKKLLVQAHPNYTPKVYIYLDEREELIVSFPLRELKPREREFYKWGGELTLEELKEGKRVPGVDKRLKLILPRPWGHIEYSIIGREGEVAKIVGVSIETIYERIRVLTRRREIGRTGLYIKEEIPPEKPVEEIIVNLVRKNKLFRKALSL